MDGAVVRSGILWGISKGRAGLSVSIVMLIWVMSLVYISMALRSGNSDSMRAWALVFRFSINLCLSTILKLSPRP